MGSLDNMNNIYIYAAIAIAYQAFKFIRARQKAALEAEQKALYTTKKNFLETVTYQPTLKKIEQVYEESYSEAYEHPILKQSKLLSYENSEIKPQIETTNIKEYHISKTKKAAFESRFEGIKSVSKSQHSILKSLKSKSEVQKAFIYSEIFKPKF